MVVLLVLVLVLVAMVVVVVVVLVLVAMVVVVLELLLVAAPAPPSSSVVDDVAVLELAESMMLKNRSTNSWLSMSPDLHAWTEARIRHLIP